MLKLIFLDNNKWMWQTGVCTLAELPVRAPKPYDAILSKWMHLRGVSVVIWGGERMNLLLDCNLPEAH